MPRARRRGSRRCGCASAAPSTTRRAASPCAPPSCRRRSQRALTARSSSPRAGAAAPHTRAALLLQVHLDDADILRATVLTERQRAPLRADSRAGLRAISSHSSTCPSTNSFLDGARFAFSDADTPTPRSSRSARRPPASRTFSSTRRRNPPSSRGPAPATRRRPTARRRSPTAAATARRPGPRRRGARGGGRDRRRRPLPQAPRARVPPARRRTCSPRARAAALGRTARSFGRRRLRRAAAQACLLRAVALVLDRGNVAQLDALRARRPPIPRSTREARRPTWRAGHDGVRACARRRAGGASTRRAPTARPLLSLSGCAPRRRRVARDPRARDPRARDGGGGGGEVVRGRRRPVALLRHDGPPPRRVGCARHRVRRHRHHAAALDARAGRARRPRRLEPARYPCCGAFRHYRLASVPAALAPSAALTVEHGSLRAIYLQRDACASSASGLAAAAATRRRGVDGCLVDWMAAQPVQRREALPAGGRRRRDAAGRRPLATATPPSTGGERRGQPDDFALFHVDVTLRRAAVAAGSCAATACAPLDDRRSVRVETRAREDDLYQGDGASSGAAAPRGGWAVAAAAAAVVAARALR